jgi:signal transduction histidine kinase
MQAFAEPVVRLTPQQPYQRIAPMTGWYVDGTAQLSFEQIQAPFYQARFHLSKHKVGAFGVTDAAIWAHGTFSAPGADKAYLLVEFANIDSITLYYYDRGILKTIKSGSHAPLAGKIMNIPGFCFELPTGEGLQEFWLRVRTDNAVIVPLAIATAQGVPRALAGMYILELIYAGIVLALFFYNLSLFLWIGDKNYLYYLGYLFFLAAFVLLYLRGFHVMMGETWSHLINIYGMGFVAVSYLFAIPFSISFLRGPEHAPRLTRVLRLFSIVPVIALICILAGNRPWTILLQEITSIVVPTLFISLAVMAYRKQYKPAVYFLIAWSLLMFSIVLFAITNMGFLPIGHWYFHILPVASALEVILLSLALGHRYSLLKKEKILLQAENLRFVREQNTLLEQKVEERTQELKESNRVKDKLLGIVSHDLRAPLNNLSGLMELLELKALSPTEIRQFSQTLQINIKHIISTMLNLLNWSLSQMDRIETKPEKVALLMVVRHVMNTSRFAADQKGIHLREAVPGETIVQADRDQLELVLRNLLDNAIKFTPQGGTVTVGCRPSAGQRVLIYVSDTGKGMTKEEADRLLQESNLYTTGGTENEKGTGLGLQLCKEFVVRNGGTLQIKSEPGEGTEFYFALPGKMRKEGKGD